jgi:hypothetical protein
MRPEGELSLPPGYRMDRSDPDVWTLRRSEGWGRSLLQPLGCHQGGHRENRLGGLQR